MPLNVFTAALAVVCREHLLQEKWLLVPSLRVGFQWLDSVVRSGQPVLNVRVRTLPQFALGLAGPQLERAGVSVVGGLEQEHLVGRIFQRVRRGSLSGSAEANARSDGGVHRGSGEGYLAHLPATPGLIQTLTRALRDLRLAGITAGHLRQQRGRDWVEVPAKGLEIELLLSHYERELRRRRLVDYPAVLQLATRRLRDDLFAIPGEVLVLAPDQHEMLEGGLERQLWRSISGSRRRLLPVDADWFESGEREGSSVELMRAVGEVNEAREVLRRCLAQGIPLDEVEILHTDTQVYVPLLLEICGRLVPDDEPAPVTFAEGFAVRGFRPGRLLLAWLHWINQDHPQTTLVQMLEDGLLRLDPPMAQDQAQDMDPSVGHAALAQWLRALPIGGGRERYLPLIDGRLSRGAGPELLQLRQLVAELLQHAPPGGKREDPTQVLLAARNLLQRRARCAGQLDEYSRGRLLALVGDQLQCIERWGQNAAFSARDWLATLPDEARVGGQGPRAGCVHVAHLLHGGHSGRSCTYVVGLDDGRFPGGGRQDPLLLDGERRALSSELPTAAGRVARDLAAIGGLLGRLRGQVTLSHSCHSLQDDRELFPASLLLSIFRRTRGDDVATGLPEFVEHLSPAAAFAPTNPRRCVDPVEWWLYRLCCQNPVRDPEDVVGRHFPHLGWGLTARRARLSPQLTEYDGLVPRAGADLDPHASSTVLSATALETLGRCPLEYFFRHVLGLAPRPRHLADPSVWLDPATRGALLHQVFHRLMSQLTDRGLVPDFERDERLALRLLEREVGALRAERPPPTGEVFQRELAQLQQVVRIFLREEAELCRTSQPLYFEVAVGTTPRGAGTLLDTMEPVSVRLPDGTTVRVRGTIDRVDRLAGDAERFAVWDYKTGSSFSFRDADPFRQGRHVQNVLYLALARARLRQRVAPAARVNSFGYFFPSTFELGRRVSWSSEDLSPGLEVVQQLCQLMSAGCFVASDRVEELQRGGYADAVGSPLEVAAATAEKLQHEGNPMLDPLRRLRGYV